MRIFIKILILVLNILLFIK